MNYKKKYIKYKNKYLELKTQNGGLNLTKLFDFVQNKKLAFCFLIYDKICHEDIWYEFFKNVDPSKYNIYIHYKENKPLKYFDKYKLSNCIETSWGDISLVKAQNLLIRAGLKDNSSHIIFVSGSCIPFKSFKYIFDILDTNYSYFNKAPDEQVFPKCNKSLQYIKKEYIKKAHMFSILNYKLCNEIIKHEQKLIKWFNYKETIPDEHCYISLVYWLKMNNNIITTSNTSYSGTTTFASWNDMDDFMVFPKSIKTGGHTAHAGAYEMISKEELEYLVNSPCLFGRKFLENCTVEGESLKDNLFQLITH
jgi:hypothetical protein